MHILTVTPGDFDDLKTIADVEYIFDCIDDDNYPIELSLAVNDLPRLARMATLIHEKGNTSISSHMLNCIEEAYKFRKSIVC